MKRIYAAFAMLILVISPDSYAQGGNRLPKLFYIEPYRLEVTYNKTSNLVFPEAITSIDRGSQDILVQKAEGVENILRIKAAAKGFEETNLSVITRDGKLYSFLVCYTALPKYFNVNIATPALAAESVASSTGTTSKWKEGDLQSYAERVLRAKGTMRPLKDQKAKMQMHLAGLYVRGNVLFCKLTIWNASNIDFDIDVLRFYIRDKKLPKRTASQETDVVPLYQLGNASHIRGKGSETIVFALPKFTIADDKLLYVEVMEKKGARNLQVKAKNKHLMKAAVLSN